MRYTLVTCAPVRHAPIRYTLMRLTPMKHTPMKHTSIRHTLMRYMPVILWWGGSEPYHSVLVWSDHLNRCRSPRDSQSSILSQSFSSGTFTLLLVLSTDQPLHNIHTSKMHARKTHAHEMHAREVHAYELHVCKVHTYKIHAYEIHAYEIHTYEMHGYEVYVYEVYPQGAECAFRQVYFVQVSLSLHGRPWVTFSTSTLDHCLDHATTNSD
jgi:hypothetical protein